MKGCEERERSREGGPACVMKQAVAKDLSSSIHTPTELNHLGRRAADVRQMFDRHLAGVWQVSEPRRARGMCEVCERHVRGV